MQILQDVIEGNKQQFLYLSFTALIQKNWAIADTHSTSVSWKVISETF